MSYGAPGGIQSTAYSQPRALSKRVALGWAAANTGAIVEIASAADFETLVMKASTQAPPVGGPVILDLYADWCEPCKKLTPILERLVVQSAGSVRLAKVDVDKLPELAQALQVKSMPTVMLVHQGTVDSYLESILTHSIDQTAQKQAMMEANAKASFLNEIVDGIETEASDESVVRDLISSFLLPEVSRADLRAQVRWGLHPAPSTLTPKR